MATPDLIPAIRNGQVEQLVRIPGVGKKTAERIVLELKDKLEGVGTGGGAAAWPKSPPPRSALWIKMCSRRC